jgi:hypothetical protein
VFWDVVCLGQASESYGDVLEGMRSSGSSEPRHGVDAGVRIQVYACLSESVRFWKLRKCVPVDIVWDLLNQYVRHEIFDRWRIR